MTYTPWTEKDLEELGTILDSAPDGLAWARQSEVQEIAGKQGRTAEQVSQQLSRMRRERKAKQIRAIAAS